MKYFDGLKYARLLLFAALLLLAISGLSVKAQTVLWRIGKPDGSSAEFTGAAASSLPTSYTIPSNWNTLTRWPQWPASVGPVPSITTINYTLASKPAYGVMFIFKPTTASALVPELAVYSNSNPCGIIQIGGADAPVGYPPASMPTSTYTRKFSRTYQLYIPPQFLVAGANTLQLARLGHPFIRTNATWLDFSIDYLELDTLAAPATEPLHGKMAYVGYSDGEMDIDPAHIAKEQAQAEWMGVAYSGNPARVTFWKEVASRQPPASQLAYLQKLKSLNMAVILDGWGCFQTTDSNLVNGQLPADAQTYISSLFTHYGSLARFYEITNEPTQSFSNCSYKYCLAAAAYVNTIKPPTLLVAAPGYSFGGTFGYPLNWDGTLLSLPKGQVQPTEPQCISNRQALDNLCNAYNGHNWGYSTWGDNTSPAENIDSHGTSIGNNTYQVANGWDKPMIATECGSATPMFDIPLKDANGNYAILPSKTSALDRNLRFNIATGDYLCAADMWNGDTSYNYIEGPPSDLSESTDPTVWNAAPSDPSNDTQGNDKGNRVSVLRRLALAYGTHGRPLPYTWQNLSPLVQGTTPPLGYFRAVDTSTLAPIPGSGATSNKILLSFVNFDMFNSTTIAVNVPMPNRGTYTADIYTSLPSYTAAHTAIGSFVTNSDGTLPQSLLPTKITLGPGEATEYIISPSNLVSDPGFEYQPITSALSLPWYTYGFGAGVDVNLGNQNSGNNEAFIYKSGPDNQWSSIQQDVAVAPNENYVLSAWIRTSNNLTPIPYFGSCGYLVASSTTGGGSLGQVSFDSLLGYTPLTVYFNSQSNSVVTIGAGYWAKNSSGSSWIQLDDVSLSQH